MGDFSDSAAGRSITWPNHLLLEIKAPPTVFSETIENIFREGRDLIRRKNADYTKDQDPFLNFRGAEQLGMSVEQGMLLRMQDKMSRLSVLFTRATAPKVIDETASDTLLDLMNYSALLLAYRQMNPSNPLPQPL